ncbi:MAG: transcription antitermination factor NusB [Parachlamydiales bacterium]|jgi:N utilization substance protein B
MSIARQKFREIVLQILYSTIFSPEDDGIVDLMMEQIKTSKKNILSAIDYVKKIQANLDLLDTDIKNAANSYEIDRISKVELCILRLGLYEMIYDESIPPKVAISEAIRLTKKFANYHSVSFVNAILDSVYKKNELAKK